MMKKVAISEIGMSMSGRMAMSQLRKKKKILKENQQTKKSYNSKKSPRLLLLEVIGLPQRSAIN